MKKFLSLVIVFSVCFNVSIVNAFAAGGDGSGGGPGPNAPMKLEECNVYDGMENADTNLNIVMRFTKNVADMMVRENNEKGISLKKETGEDADYEVYFPEEFEKRQYIEVNAKLEPNTTYVLKLETSIVARNEVNFLDKEYSISFTTGDGKTESTDENVNQNNDKIAETSAQADTENEVETQTKNKNIVPIVSVVIVVAVISVIVVVKKRGK